MKGAVTAFAHGARGLQNLFTTCPWARRRKPGAARSWRVLLRFWEQIQGYENAFIAHSYGTSYYW